jgi:ABC-type nitrate/sulfonate/bicarbonate transport system permease component
MLLRRPPRTLARATARYGLRAAVLLAALGLWQGLSAAGAIPASEFPSMTATISALGHQVTSAGLWSAVRDTLAGWAIGLLIGGGSAIIFGSLTGLSGFAYRSAIGVIEFFKTIPVIAILPIALVLWGATLTMKFALVAFAVFWPLVIQVFYGVRSIDPTVRDTATALQVRGVRRFFMVVLPSAAPFIATGLRVAVAVALIVDIVAELIGGGGGVGERILTAEDSGPAAYPIMYAYILVAGLLGMLLAGLFALAEHRVLHWHESQRAEAGHGALPSRAGPRIGEGVAPRGAHRGVVGMVGGQQVDLLPAP